MSIAVGAGSEVERYLRALELVGKLPSGQWTIRSFGPAEIARMKLPERHPWSDVVTDSALDPRHPLSIISPTTQFIGNSSFAYGFNDGPIWAGKGVTAAITGGFALRRSGFSLVLDPIVFAAQNAHFTLASTGPTAPNPYADPSTPTTIDLPQRFGASSYARFDLGESSLRWDGHGVAVGLSTGAEVWGPAYEHPVVLGNNAGGFPRLVVGTSAPRTVGIFTIHGHLLWGRVDESAFGPDTGESRRHFVTGAVATLSVRGLPGLELGGDRFFHIAWPPNGLIHAPWARVFQEFIGSPQQTSSKSFGYNPDNQLASAFARWAPPGLGFEVYGEYGRDDRNSDWEDFWEEIDHDAAYLVGFARAWTGASSDRVTVFRGELLNSRISRLQQARPQASWYVHDVMTDGHTEQGQALGSVGGHGGGAMALAVDWYSRSGRTTVRWDRLIQAMPLSSSGLPIAEEADVTHAIGVERARFIRRGELTVAATLVKDFNRYFASDALNANVAVTYRLLR